MRWTFRCKRWLVWRRCCSRSSFWITAGAWSMTARGFFSLMLMLMLVLLLRPLRRTISWLITSLIIPFGERKKQHKRVHKKRIFQTKIYFGQLINLSLKSLSKKKLYHIFINQRIISLCGKRSIWSFYSFITKTNRSRTKEEKNEEKWMIY